MPIIFHNRELLQGDVPAGYVTRPFDDSDVRIAWMQLDDMRRRGDSNEACLEAEAWLHSCAAGRREGWLITVRSGSRTEPVIE